MAGTVLDTEDTMLTKNQSLHPREGDRNKGGSYEGINHLVRYEMCVGGGGAGHTKKG